MWLAALAAAVTFLSILGLWANQRADQAAADSASSPAGLFLESQAKGTPLVSVGRTSGLARPCTAWLIDTGGTASNSAYAVTAGRCVGIDDADTALAGEPVTGATVEFNAFAPVTTAVQPHLVLAPADEIAWASVQGTDLAVLRLGVTQGELAAQGVAPIPAVATPAQGTEVLVAGVPVEEIPSNERYLRGTRCTVGVTTDVREGPWLLADARASNCSGTLDGSWGSPAFNPAGEAVAMVSTTTIGAAADSPDCEGGRPCEVRAGTVTVVQPDTTYLVAVDALNGCFADGTFTPGGDCRLGDATAGEPSPGPS